MSMNTSANLISLHKNKYNIPDVYEIAKERDALVIEENLGNQVAGYYNTTNDKKLIHVNSEIPSYCKNFVIAYFLRYFPNKCTENTDFVFLSMNHLAQLAQCCTAET